MGKTHLLQAIRQYVNAHYPTYTVRYVSTEAFLNQFVDAIRTNMMSDFKRRYREIDVLLVETSVMEGQEGQKSSSHTFHSLHQATPDLLSPIGPRLDPALETGFAFGSDGADHESSP